MNKATLFLRIAAISGLLAVALGAFGAHSLERLLTPDMLETYQVGVRYQFYHTLALFGLAIWLQQHPSSRLIQAGYCFIVGILFFSGSLYLLATREVLGIWWNMLGIITPIGGLFFMVGWLLILIYSFSPASKTGNNT